MSRIQMIRESSGNGRSPVNPATAGAQPPVSNVAARRHSFRGNNQLPGSLVLNGLYRGRGLVGTGGIFVDVI